MSSSKPYPVSGATLGEFDWVANHNGGNGGDSGILIDRRSDLVIFGYVNDAEANYSFDDYALVRLDANYYLLNTSGCSCPSPTEEWGIAFGPVPLPEMRKHLEDLSGDRGYGVTKRQHGEFMGMLAVAEAEKIAPVTRTASDPHRWVAE